MMNLLESLLWVAASIVSFYGLLILMYLWIFGGPGVLDDLPLPDKKE